MSVGEKRDIYLHPGKEQPFWSLEREKSVYFSKKNSYVYSSEMRWFKDISQQYLALFPKCVAQNAWRVRPGPPSDWLFNPSPGSALRNSHRPMKRFSFFFMSYYSPLSYIMFVSTCPETWEAQRGANNLAIRQLTRGQCRAWNDNRRLPA